MDDIFKFERNEDEDFYRILGCSELSTIEQINVEYKARVLDCHPDKHPNDTEAGERFARLQKAKEILTDPESRAKYDTWKGSGLAMSFDQWIGLHNSVHTSMHWASVKTQPMLVHETTENFNFDSHGQSGKTDRSQDDVQQSYQMSQNFKVSEHSNFGGIPWERDPASETLRKFRNYEI